MKLQNVNIQNVELLAPAGSLQSFFAAIESGADAVFCGLKVFSARAKAKNFTMAELSQLVGYTHRLNKKIYVALNTLVKENELPELITVLQELEYLSIDGLIIQDLGLYHLLHTYFPKIPIHASTQMVIHNLAGALFLEKIGFERVVLARELSLAEISHISKNCSIEIEHFIHGALCYSMSGHCLFSSYIDGRSGNRGRCIQPCRRKYHHGDDSGFYFSTSDFSAIELIPQVVNAGVMSLKIEGRMKSPEYVAAVVSAYRTVLDAKKGEEKNSINQAKEQLETAMGRKSSPGFLPGKGGADIVLPKRKGGVGKIIGKVEKIQGNSVSFKTAERIHIGDRLRIQPGNDRAGQGFTVRSLALGKKGCKVVSRGSFVSIPLPPKVKKGKVRIGDLVFMLVSGKSFSMSEEACKRQLKTAPTPAQQIDLSIVCNENDSSLIVQAGIGDELVSCAYPVEMILAKKSPLSRETLFKVFAHTGYPELSLSELETNSLPPVVIKPSRLKEIRRDFYGNIQGKITHSRLEQSSLRLSSIKASVRDDGETSKVTKSSQLYIATDQQNDLAAIGDNSDLIFVFPLNRELFERAMSLQFSSVIKKRQLIWDLPSVLFDTAYSEVEGLIEMAIDAGFSCFRLNNPSQFEFFNSVSGVSLISGPWLYSLNSQTMRTLDDMGVSLISLSIEDDKENFKMLLRGSHRGSLLITVYSPVDLFTSRITPTIQKDTFVLKNDSGDQFDVKQVQGLAITQASKPFSLIGKIFELKQLGCENFIIDLQGIGFSTASGQSVVRSFSEDQNIKGTILLNYETGLN